MIYKRSKHHRILLRKYIQRLKKLSYKWNVYIGQQQIPRDTPSKIMNTSPIPLPKLKGTIPVHVTKGHTILYDNSAKLVHLDAQQFITYAGGLNLSIVQMEIKCEDIPPLVKLNMDSIEKCNLWYYRGNRITHWHYDGHDNFLYVLKGQKHVYLSKPGSLKCLSIFSANNNQAKEISSDGHFKVVVKENQCLYIPKGWFHKIISFGSPNIAINFWGNSLKRIKPYEYDCGLRYLVCEMAERQVNKVVDNLIRTDKQTSKKNVLIMQTPFNQITKQMLTNPIDYELLGRKLDKNEQYQDLTNLWLHVNYEQFISIRDETRRKIFFDYFNPML